MRLSYTALALLMCVYIKTAYCDDFFDPALISQLPGMEHVDLSVFNQSGGGLAGEQEVDIYINDIFFQQTNLFFLNNDEKKLVPQLSIQLLEKMGINTSRLSSSQFDANGIESSELIGHYPFMKIDFNQAASRLDISVPQSYLTWSAMTLKSDPTLWDHGIPAFLVDYRISGNQNNYSNNQTKSYFTSLNLGLNLLDWYFRNQSTYSIYNHNGRSKHEFNSFANYVERDINNIKSTISIGDLTTKGRLIDSIPFLGVSLKNNSQMLRTELASYSPIIYGMANSAAEVIIQQNDKVVYRTNVAPGPFELKDLNIYGLEGDLLVTVKESDGSSHSFLQAYSSLPEMKRIGTYDYEVALGKYHSTSDYYHSLPFLYSHYSYGAFNGITLYGAFLFANDYLSTGIGSTFSLGSLGAVSGDFTFSQANIEQKNHLGQSYGLKYAKILLVTDTTFTLSAYRYSTDDFYTFQEFLYKGGEDYSFWSNNKQRNRITLSLSQKLNNWGYLNLNITRQEFWNNHSIAQSVGLTHSILWNDINFMTSIFLNKESSDGQVDIENKQIAWNMEIPIGKFLSNQSSTYLNYGINHDGKHSQHTMGLKGNFNNNISYMMQQEGTTSHIIDSGILSLNYTSNTVNGYLGYHRDKEGYGMNYGLSGSAVIYSHGMALTANSVMNGVAMVNTANIKDIAIQGTPISTNHFGNTLITSLDYYNRNTVTIDPIQLPNNVTLVNSSKTFYPIKGAVVLLDYDLLVGQQVVFTLFHDGMFIPFGSIVKLKGTQIENSGIVDSEGRVYLAGIPQKGTLIAYWGIKDSCEVDFVLPNTSLPLILEQELYCV